MHLPIIIEISLVKDIQIELSEKWQELSQHLGLDEILTAQLWNNILEKYSESHRTYHNLSHLYSMFRIKTQWEDALAHPRLFDLAIWYHDIIYNTVKKDNELQSRDLFAHDFAGILPEEDLNYVCQLILSTNKHVPIRKDFDNFLFLDIDLAVLATQRDMYRKYTNAIRREYRLYPSFLYNRGRKKIMESFLEREQIYYTDFFQEHFEEQARANVGRELEQL